MDQHTRALPVELASKIAAMLRYNRETLRHLAQVSSQWRVVAQQVLFFELTVFFGKTEELNDWIDRFTRDMTNSSAGPLSTPNRHVRSLQLCIGVSNIAFREELSVCTDTLRVLVSYLPNLKNLRLCGFWMQGPCEGGGQPCVGTQTSALTVLRPTEVDLLLESITLTEPALVGLLGFLKVNELKCNRVSIAQKTEHWAGVLANICALDLSHPVATGAGAPKYTSDPYVPDTPEADSFWVSDWCEAASTASLKALAVRCNLNVREEVVDVCYALEGHGRNVQKLHLTYYVHRMLGTFPFVFALPRSIRDSCVPDRRQVHLGVSG